MMLFTITTRCDCHNHGTMRPTRCDRHDATEKCKWHDATEKTLICGAIYKKKRVKTLGY